jgi:hypothetical protein
VLLLGASACKLDTVANQRDVSGAVPEPGLALGEAPGIRSLTANVGRRMKFTEPTGAVRNELVTYHLAKNRKDDGSWETVITPSPRAPLFDDSSGNAKSQRQISQIKYTDPNSPTMTFSDGSTAALPRRADLAAVSVAPTRGMRLTNPVVDGFQAPHVGPHVSTPGPFVATASSAARTIQTLGNAFGNPNRLSPDRLEFSRSVGSRQTRIVFDEKAGAVTEEVVTDGGRLMFQRKRLFTEVAPGVFLPSDTELVVPILGGKGMMEVQTQLSNISVTQ